MAQGSIRKGFFFYFGLFILLLVSAFLVCLVIMMFNPGKTVLWMKYFSGKQEFAVKETTAETKDGKGVTVDYSTLTDIVINCNYANVTVQSNKEYVDDYIVIRNYAKGFSSAKKYAPFSYKATLDGTKLVIDLKEPTGFMYFSKDVEVIVNDSVSVGKMNLSNINLKVNARGKSNVYVGGTTNKNEVNFALRTLDVKTDNGIITLGKRFNTSAVSGAIDAGKEEDNYGIRLYTRAGSIKAANTLNYGSKTGSGIRQTTQNVSIGTNKGRINLDVVDLGTKKFEIKCKKGTVAIDTISAGLVDVKDCINGNYKFNKVLCDMSFFGAADTIISPIININDLAGEFRLLATGKKDAPIVNIKNSQKKVSVTAEKGSVTLSNAKGEVDLTSSASMAVKVTIDQDNANLVRIVNEKGKIRLKFLGAVSSDARIITNTSSVNVDFTKNANFTANCFKKDGTTPMASSKVNVNLGKSGVTYDYNKTTGTLAFSGMTGHGNLTINSNEEVDFNLVSVA